MPTPSNLGKSGGGGGGLLISLSNSILVGAVFRLFPTPTNKRLLILDFQYEQFRTDRDN